MVSLSALWIPILVSAVAVFIASSIVHMVLPHHRSDFKAVSREDDFLEAIRQFNISPGDYVAPRPSSQSGMSNPQFLEKVKRGPRVMMTVVAGGSPAMGKSLALWFLYLVVVSIFAADLGADALPRGSGVEDVCFFVGTAAFMGYALALLHAPIWYGTKWSTTLKSVADGFVYALITGQTFGWLWPK